MTGAGAPQRPVSQSCAVFSGDWIALLLTPGTGVCKHVCGDRRRDTDGWWRQVTKLPRPIPQYPPFTLRYGFVRLLRRACGVTSAVQLEQGAARTFDAIVLTDGGGDAPRRRPQAVLASVPAMQRMLLLAYRYEREPVPLFFKVRRG